jgi:hypothetical protein
LLTLTFISDEAPPPSNGREVSKWLDDRGEMCGRAFSFENFHRLEWRGLGVFAFSTGSLEVQVWPEATAPPDLIIQVFSRMLQPVILQALGWQALHASATAGPDGVFAFCGISGCGKSTLAFAMQQAGWCQFADDAVVLRFGGNCVLACPLPFTPRLRPRSRTHFAQRRSNLALCAERQLSALPLTAVFLLRQDDELTSPRIALIPRARAFSELLVHAHCFDVADPKHTRQLVNDYLRLSAAVPVFTLEFCPAFEYLPQLIRTLVDVASGAALSPETRPAAARS